jgi:hypothetical protein
MFAVPRIEVDGFHTFNHVAQVNSSVEGLCDVRITTLRCLSSERTPDDGRHRRYELEAHGTVEGLREIEVELPPPWNPWEEVGWFDEASAWIRDRVDAPVEQRSARSISAFLRAGDAYFKAVPRIFAAEPAITRGLSRLHPGLVPEVIDVDVDRGWLLTRDFGDEQLAASDPERRAEALEAYADLQLAWVGREDELFGLGCPDRTLGPLDEHLGVVLGDVDAMLPGHPEGLSDDQIRALPDLRARLSDAAARVATFDIPATLDHGDLHAENIALRDGRPLIFDWSDACLALPLVSVTTMLAWDDIPVRVRKGLRDAYLERLGAPVAAYDDAMLLGLAHQAVSYHRITEGTAPHSRWEWEQVLPWIVKQLLER